MADDVQAIAITVALITAGATLLGVLIGVSTRSYFERWKEETEKRKTKAEKLGEFSSLLVDNTLHLRLFEGYLRSGDDWDTALRKLPPHPFIKMAGIADVYFSEFQKAIDQLTSLCFDYLLFVYEHKKEDIEKLGETNDYYEKLEHAHDDLSRTVRQYAKLEFQ